MNTRIGSWMSGLAVAGAVTLMALAPAATAQADAVGYQFDITTSYQFGDPANLVGGGNASPDTGFLTITNNGSSTFTGDLRIFGIAGGGADVDFTKTGAFNPGDSFAFAAGPEGSNQGGFNGTQGLQFTIIGTVTDGISEAVSLSVFDQDIHSGVFVTNPYGVLLDNYVLEGGDATRDTNDAFEVSQAPGRFSFSEARSVPEPGSLALVGLGAASFYLARRRRLASRS